MATSLNSVEIRILGALLEKQMATPDYYPLTLNALTSACNQLTNRDPVVAYDEDTVRRGLESLRARGLVRCITGADMRVPKYEQAFTELCRLERPEAALVCLLLLRGAQTAGELRSRSGRLCEFNDLAQVETALKALIDRQPQPLITQLPRQPGTKESRYCHLLGDEPAAASEERLEANHLSRLEAEIHSLRAELQALKHEFAEFKKAFD